VKGIVCTYVGHYSNIRLFTSGFRVIAESRDSLEMQYTGLNKAVLGHGKSLSLRSHKSCGHSDLCNVKGIVCTYVGHYNNIRLFTSVFHQSPCPQLLWLRRERLFLSPCTDDAGRDAEQRYEFCQSLRLRPVNCMLGSRKFRRLRRSRK